MYISFLLISLFYMFFLKLFFLLKNTIKIINILYFNDLNHLTKRNFMLFPIFSNNIPKVISSFTFFVFFPNLIFRGIFLDIRVIFSQVIINISPRKIIFIIIIIIKISGRVVCTTKCLFVHEKFLVFYILNLSPFLIIILLTLLFML